MLFSDSVGRKVVSTATAQTVGTIDQLLIDPPRHSVVALQLKHTEGDNILAWSAMTAFGQDAVTVPGADAITAGDDRTATLSGKDHRVLKKRVLTAGGDEIGSVDDVEFDPDTGEVIALHLGDDRVEGVRLVGVGSYAVVVQVDTA